MPEEYVDIEYPVSASLPTTRRARRTWMPDDIGGAWARAYVAVWVLTLAPAVLVASAGTALVRPTRRLLGLQLSARAHPPAHLSHAIVLAAHNIPIAGWPLLLGAAGAARQPILRRAADILVLASMIANTLPVGAALGAYGTPLLPYLPQLPLEWGALALGSASWLLQRRGRLSARQRLGWLAAIGAAIMGAAVLETFTSPHR